MEVRRLEGQPECSVKGCREFVEDKVFDRLWCSTHAEYIKFTAAERNYRDFVQAMRNRGIKGNPLTQDPGGQIEDRQCAIPECKGAVVSGTNLFTPFVKPGMVWVCQKHVDILHEVGRKQHGPRLIHELSLQREQKSDPDRRKREKAILSACAKHKGKPNYIEQVCRELQEQRIKMPQRWLDRWGNDSVRFENTEWFRAYQHKRSKPAIQRYVSKVCTLKVKSPPK